MNVGEKSAAEAMLGLSRLTYPAHPSHPSQPSQPFHPSHPPSLSRHCYQSMSITSSATSGLPLRPTNGVAQSYSLDMTSGSSVSPSNSPTQKNSEPQFPPASDIGKPRAMRLSQLLTDDSPLETTSGPANENYIAQQPHYPPYHQLQFPYTSQYPVRQPTANRSGISVTEPVTPPFSPVVLPPLSGMAGLAIPQQLANNNENATLQSSTWVRTPMTTVKTANMVLASRDSNMRVAPSTLNQVALSTKTKSTTEAMKKIVKRPYKKYYSNPTPSSHCHVCARTSKAVKFAVCARIAEGLCRKVTCYKCFAKFGWDWESAVNSKTWICVHCRGVCPEGRSQCYIYNRVNSKRETKRGKRSEKTYGVGQGAAIGSVSENSRNGVSLERSASAGAGLPSVRRVGGQGVSTFSDASTGYSLIQPL